MRAAFDEVVTKISANQATPAFKAKIADLFDKATVRFSASQSAESAQNSIGQGD